MASSSTRLDFIKLMMGRITIIQVASRKGNRAASEAGETWVQPPPFHLLPTVVSQLAARLIFHALGGGSLPPRQDE
jgi:hypothetical protein